MPISSFRYLPSAACAIPALFVGGDALKHAFRPGRNGGQQVGNALQGLSMGAVAGGLGWLAWKGRPTNVDKVTGFFSADTIKRAGNSMLESGEALQDKAKDLVGRRVSHQGSREESHGSNGHDFLNDEIDSLPHDSKYSSGASTPRTASPHPESEYENGPNISSSDHLHIRMDHR